MMGYTDRTYASEGDPEAMINLLATRLAKGITDYPGIVDLREMLDTAEVRANTRLWEDLEGRLVGFAIVHPTYGRLLFEIAPWAADSEVAAQMIGWGGGRVRDAQRESGESVPLRTGSRDNNSERIVLLERHGFVRQEEHTLYMVRPLDGPIPRPQVSEGFTALPLAPKT